MLRSERHTKYTVRVRYSNRRRPFARRDSKALGLVAASRMRAAQESAETAPAGAAAESSRVVPFAQLVAKWARHAVRCRHRRWDEARTEARVARNAAAGSRHRRSSRQEWLAGRVWCRQERRWSVVDWARGPRAASRSGSLTEHLVAAWKQRRCVICCLPCDSGVARRQKKDLQSMSCLNTQRKNGNEKNRIHHRKKTAKACDIKFAEK